MAKSPRPLRQAAVRNRLDDGVGTSPLPGPCTAHVGRLRGAEASASPTTTALRGPVHGRCAKRFRRGWRQGSWARSWAYRFWETAPCLTVVAQQG